MGKSREDVIREHLALIRNRAVRLREVKRGNLKRVRAPHWTVVRTAHGMENFARLQIEEGGNRAFVPRIYDGGFGHKLKPLFRGYVFVELPDNRWMHLQSTKGVISVVRMNGKAVRCPDDVINQLIIEQGADGYIDLAPDRYIPMEGDTVKIINGLFKDHIARYIGRSPDLVMLAALDFMGKEVVTRIKRGDIEKVNLAAISRRVGGATPKSK